MAAVISLSQAPRFAPVRPKHVLQCTLLTYRGASRNRLMTDGAGCIGDVTSRFQAHSAASTNSSSGRGRGERGRGRGAGRGGRGRGRRGGASKPQVHVRHKLPAQPTVAIIGGGFSGLICAQECVRLGLQPTVFDTGEHGFGGRLATRTSADASLRDSVLSERLVFDHAAQFFTASDPWFAKQVAQWQSADRISQWQGPVGTLEAGIFSMAAAAARFVAPGGMRSLAEHLAANLLANGVELRRPCWVSDMEATAQGWALRGRNRAQGVFDFVVIAHNGKCANRLLQPAGVPKVAAQMKALKLSSIWVLMVAFDGKVEVPGRLEGAFVDSDVLSWIGNNTRKLSLAEDSGTECWTIMSTPEYGQKNKVPQENVPEAKAQQVTADLLAAFQHSLGAEKLPKAVFSKVQLWGAALPTNTPGSACIMDADGRVGICGDWLLGSSMQAAALSGKNMAEQIAACTKTSATPNADTTGLHVGLDVGLQPLQGTAIGQFP